MWLILDPLIALGLVDNREEVSAIIESEDDDGSGLLEFDEFLRIMKQFFLDSHVHFSLLNYIQNFSMSRK